MTERFKPTADFEDIPRRSPTIEVPLRDRTERLTWYNTCIVFYTQDEFLDMTHVEITNHEEGSRGIVFSSRPLVQLLMNNSFPMMSAPEPPRGVLEAYYRYTADEIESELPRFMDEE